jgi:hypothetical protein
MTAASASAGGSSTESAVRAVLAERRDADVEALGPGVRGDDRVRGPQERVAEAVGDRGFADARQAEGADRDAGPEAPRGEPGLDLGGPHRPQLSRRPGQGDHDPAVGPIEPPARRRAEIVRQRDGRRDPPGLLEVRRGEGEAPPIEEADEPRLELGIDARRLADDGGDRLAREVVGRRPEPARRDDEVSSPERVAHGVAHRLEVVRQGHDPEDADPCRRERPRVLARIRVDRLADGDLAADGQQLGGPDRAVGRHDTGA